MHCYIVRYLHVSIPRDTSVYQYSTSTSCNTIPWNVSVILLRVLFFVIPLHNIFHAILHLEYSLWYYFAKYPCNALTCHIPCNNTAMLFQEYYVQHCFLICFCYTVTQNHARSTFYCPSYSGSVSGFGGNRKCGMPAYNSSTVQSLSIFFLSRRRTSNLLRTSSCLFANVVTKRIATPTT